MQIIKSLSDGFRRKLDDLLLLQDNIMLASSSIINALLPTGIDSCILTGCTTTIALGTLSWTSGYIYIQGEIYQVASGSTTYNSSLTYYFEIISSGLNIRTKLNGISEEHHEIRSTQVTSSLTPPVGYLDLFSLNLRNAIIGDWKLIEPSDILSYFSVVDASCVVAYANALQTDRQNRVWYRRTHDTLELSASIYVTLTAIGGATSTQSAELLFPEELIAHLNADGYSPIRVFPNTSYEIGVVDINSARNGLLIQWDTPISPITGVLSIRIPALIIKLQ